MESLNEKSYTLDVCFILLRFCPVAAGVLYARRADSRERYALLYAVRCFVRAEKISMLSTGHSFIPDRQSLWAITPASGSRLISPDILRWAITSWWERKSSSWPSIIRMTGPTSPWTVRASRKACGDWRRCLDPATASLFFLGSRVSRGSILGAGAVVSKTFPRMPSWAVYRPRSSNTVNQGPPRSSRKAEEFTKNKKSDF